MKYNVKLFVMTPHHFHEVEAANEEEAERLARESFATGYQGDFIADEDTRVHDVDVEEV